MIAFNSSALPVTPTSEEWKKENLKIIITRMQGWQLDTFKESYEHKKNKGVSLFKKNLLESKN